MYKTGFNAFAMCMHIQKMCFKLASLLLFTLCSSVCIHASEESIKVTYTRVDEPDCKPFTKKFEESDTLLTVMTTEEDVQYKTQPSCGDRGYGVLTDVNTGRNISMEDSMHATVGSIAAGTSSVYLKFKRLSDNSDVTPPTKKKK